MTPSLRRLALQRFHEEAGDALAARGGGDEYALHLRLACFAQHEGAAAERPTLLPRDQKMNVERGE